MSVGSNLQGVVMKELIGQKEFLDYLAANHKQMNVDSVLADLIRVQQIVIAYVIEHQTGYESHKQSTHQTWGKF
jgi:hypothetical protein